MTGLDPLMPPAFQSGKWSTPTPTNMILLCGGDGGQGEGSKAKPSLQQLWRHLLGRVRQGPCWQLSPGHQSGPGDGGSRQLPRRTCGLDRRARTGGLAAGLVTTGVSAGCFLGEIQPLCCDSPWH